MKLCILCTNYVPIRTADKAEGSCIYNSCTVPSFSSCEDGFKSISLKASTGGICGSNTAK